MDNYKSVTMDDKDVDLDAYDVILIDNADHQPLNLLVNVLQKKPITTFLFGQCFSNNPIINIIDYIGKF